MRKIPDEQIALYIEEHRSDLDGVLITAAEYAGKGGSQPGQAALIEAVMKEASARSAGNAIAHVVDLSRLKKYGVAALAGIVIYILASALFPNAVAHHISRILKPWEATAEDKAKKSSGPGFWEPVKFKLSKGDENIPRGTSLDLEAELSRPAGKPVVLNFRPPAAGGEWQTIQLTEIEKLNGFKGTLADVSEDLDFYVSCGTDRSEIHHIKVFDPLVVQSLEVTTHYPEYTKLPDRVEASAGDVAALEGSTVTVRILTSTPLKEGQVKWSNGQTQKMTVEEKANSVAAFSFEVKTDGSYDYSLADINGQQAGSAVSLTVHATPDAPPTLKVLAPKFPVALTHPVGEVRFAVEADDDFGVAGVDLVYTRLDDKGESQETRAPLTLVPGDTKPAPNAVRGTYALSLEDARPPFNPEEAISYHLEAHDTKGQKAVSEIGMILVGYYETWSTWDIHPPEKGSGVHPEKGPDLLAMLQMTWQLNTQNPRMSADDFLAESKKLGAMMNDSNGGLRDFVDLEHFPQLKKAADKITLHAKNGRDALLLGDTAKASVELRIAAALAAGGKLEDEMKLMTMQNEAPAPGGGSMNSDASATTTLEQQRLEAASAASNQARVEKEQGDAKTAADTSKALGSLISKQDQVIAQSKGSKANAASLVSAEKALAQEAKNLADQTKAKASAANVSFKSAAGQIANAAALMGAAAADLAKGDKAQGEAKATAANKLLADAQTAVSNTGRDKLEEAISHAAASAAALLADQKALHTKTEGLAKELGVSTNADQRQARDLKVLAENQAKLSGEEVALNSESDHLNAWAETAGKPEVVKILKEVALAIKRNKPEQRMANAAVDLNTTNPASAAENQQKAEETLKKIVDLLRRSDDAVSNSKEAKLSRMVRTAQEAKAALAAVAASQAPNAPGKAPQPANAPGQAPQPANAPGKAPQPANAPGKAHATQPATASGRQAAATAASKIAEISKTLGDSPVDPKELEALVKISEDEDELAKSLLTDPEKLEKVTGIINNVSERYEAELEGIRSGKKIFASQREECPPKYRRFVNKYFQVLSEIERPPEQAKKP